MTRVLFMPDFREKNPYQHLLEKGLTGQGIVVTYGRDARWFPVLRSVARNWKPDILHLHWVESLYARERTWTTVIRGGLLALELGLVRIMRIRIVWTVHNLSAHESRHRWIERAIHGWLVRHLYSGIIAHCEAAREEVLSEFGGDMRLASRTVVIPHGSYRGVYPNDITCAEARKLLAIPDNATVYLCLGQIRKYKGVEELVRSFTQLDDAKARLVIAGQALEAGQAHELQALASDGRIMLRFGYIPDDGLQTYLNAADVVVLPFKDVLTSGSAILAMSFGKPVVVPAIGCLPDLFVGGGAVLYDPADPAGLLNAMRSMRELDLIDLGRRNKEAASLLSWDMVGRSTAAFYHSHVVR